MTTASLAPGPGKAPTAPRPPWTLEQYLREHPWPAEWAALGPTYDFLWHFELRASVEALWPYVADTSTFNRRAGFPQMFFTEKKGKVEGRCTSAGNTMVWEEVPWEWEDRRALSNARIYSQGFLQVVRARYLLDTVGPNQTRLTVYMGVVPKGLKGRIFTRLGMASMQKTFATAFAGIEAAIVGKTVLPPAEPPPVLDAAAQQRMASARTRMVSDGLDAALVDRVIRYLAVTPDGDIHKIRPRALARAWGVDERKLLVVFLQATRNGLFTLTWDVVCPHCRGSRADVAHLGEVPKRGWCDVCGIDFDTTHVNALEVTFHVHPSIRVVEKRLFCAAEPATKPHILIQKTVAPHQRVTLDTSLAAARYRMRVFGSTGYRFLDVQRGATLRSVDWVDTAPPTPMETGEHPSITLHNSSDAPVQFVLERTTEDRDALRPVDLFGLQEFRDLFSQEAVASELQLDIGKQTILFTDLVGSTRFYEEQGDTVAFAEVRRHFVTAYAVVQRHGGVVVKTIGDAVMAAFTNPVSALEAAVELQKFFDGKRPDTTLRVRVTLHTGPCVAVNLNNNIDYFGSTVNFAAKIQAIAEAGQVGFSQDVHADGAVAAWLAAQARPVEAVDFPLKWSGGTARVYRITVG